MLKGWRNRDIARELNVSEDTVARYRVEYAEKLESQARDNPDLLIQVVKNTMAALEEVDLIRQSAWEDYQRAREGVVVECEGCGSEFVVPPSPRATQNGFLKTILQAQEQRSKLYGLFGVRQEYFLEVGRVKVLQERLLEFMKRELCVADRMKLATYLRGVDMPRADLNAPALDSPEVIDL